ncbi:ABC transporter permease [Cohnella yongneupensis]|uniref:ABC transporter permease n=1 Tax=Cohnella yongneupensis TaxID=425006 RepID=A0ABW0R1U1_9BACL
MKHVRKFWPFYLMTLPAALVLLVNNYIPMMGIIIAFKKINYTDGILGSPWSGFENFKYLFKTDAAYIITRNTLLYNAVFIILNLIIGVGLAILLNELKSKFLPKVYLGVMFLPFFLSAIVVSYIGYAFMSQEHGLINTALTRMGLTPVDWYSNPDLWPFILPLVNVWKGIGYYAIIYLAAILGISEEYYEAALIDGAGKWKQMVKITLPLLAPVMIVMTLLQIGRIFFSDFGLFYQVTLNSGSLFPTTNVIDTYVYRTFLQSGDIGLSSAAGLYQSAVGFVVVLMSNFVVRKFSKENALF